MKFFIDECISPSLSHHLNRDGLHDAIHPRDRARLRASDRVVFDRAIAEDRILVTENADDFRKLAGSVELHPGLIILPSVARAEAQWLLDLVIAHLIAIGGERPQDHLVNSVLSVSAKGNIRIEPLP